MLRVARIVIVGLPHHVTQRGDNRQVVFHASEDCQRYLAVLSVQVRRYAARAVGRTHFRYTQYWNTAEQRSGDTRNQVTTRG